MKLHSKDKNNKKSNDIPFDLSTLTPFQKKVLEVVKTIPYGETKSYKWVAERMGNPRAARAIGQALKRNPYPEIIPCHRVIRSDGKVGGYSKGIQKKRKLLKKESREK